MDFMSRDNRPAQTPATATTSPPSTGGSSKKSRGSWKSLRVLSVVLLFSAAVLILAMSASLALGSNTSNEGKYVNTKQFQAVFLNGGQVYFGHITRLNDKFLRVADIYYLRVNQVVQPNGQTANQDVSLVKLGCELHGPTDEMIIYREQVIFWENLKDDGQVAKAVAEFKKTNPNGQTCAAPASNTNSDTNTKPTTPTPAKKP
jgi:hypothetical protein